MKSSIKFITLIIIVVSALGCKEASSDQVNTVKEISSSEPQKHIIPAYVPSDKALHDTILKMDKVYFDAYNTCDLETQANMYADDLEFYHDLGGLETDKDALIKALKDNICDKVTRELVEGSMEVYPIAGYGAVAEGYHVFFNKLEPDAPQKPSKFMTIWKNTDDGWKMARIVSLH